jgi:hypothetical protein
MKNIIYLLVFIPLFGFGQTEHHYQPVIFYDSVQVKQHLTTDSIHLNNSNYWISPYSWSHIGGNALNNNVLYYNIGGNYYTPYSTFTPNAWYWHGDTLKFGGINNAERLQGRDSVYIKSHWRALDSSKLVTLYRLSNNLISDINITNSSEGFGSYSISGTKLFGYIVLDSHDYVYNTEASLGVGESFISNILTKNTPGNVQRYALTYNTDTLGWSWIKNLNTKVRLDTAGNVDITGQYKINGVPIGTSLDSTKLVTKYNLATGLNSYIYIYTPNLLNSLQLNPANYYFTTNSLINHKFTSLLADTNGVFTLHVGRGSNYNSITIDSTGFKTNKIIKIGTDTVATKADVRAHGSSGGGTWGSITGILSSQTDLNSALSGKISKGDTITHGPNQYVTPTQNLLKQNKTDTASTIQSGVMSLYDYKQMVYNSVARNLTFSGSIDLTSHKSSNYNNYTITGSLSVTIGSSPLDGSVAGIILIADGTHTPTFTGLYLTSGSWVNTSTTKNLITFWQLGGSTYFSISQPVVQ